MTKPILTMMLGERVRIMRPPGGFAPGSDAVLLAAACPARAGASVLDLGCGAGAAMLCVAARVPGVELTGLDVHRDSVGWAGRNLDDNCADGAALHGDVADPPAAVRARQFDHVICNPPYFTEGSASPDPAREAARRGLDLGPWLQTARRRVAPKGSVTFITRADRLADVLAGMEGLGGIAILPLAPRAGQPAGRVIVQGRKGARAPLKILPPFVLHRGDAHQDGDRHTPEARAVLRDAAPLPLT
ncbi:tRNA1(Val) (adenine(37)-N6)-methyltransferase [Jannaschia aquimarina]|uniref:YfiC protein n=1 Tax=Jannaschia aquimarina TaxID=935700 RepID=A0A0D1ELJ3_9RHOB|nr:methyltransferase [Jannaschia aquimarina]KIT16645.1 tRNA1(Val) (adenine(37)-N6)-methyltransferase [Jannaschia aquimarina]SNS93464.1 tRNA1(Val) A37 N6-methylase TrmN6 [Jannaschia aquimarina]